MMVGVGVVLLLVVVVVREKGVTCTHMHIQIDTQFAHRLSGVHCGESAPLCGSEQFMFFCVSKSKAAFTQRPAWPPPS